MKTLIDAEQAVGKVVENVTTHNEYAAIHFTDGTALVLEGDSEFSGQVYVEESDCKPNMVDANHLGLVTNDEYFQWAAERDRAREPQERETLQALIAKHPELARELVKGQENA